MSTRLIKITSLSLLLWLFTTTTILAQSENEHVLDTKGKPLESGKEYYIKPAITDSGGRFTLITRNNSCPLYVGQENTDLGKGLPVIFTPFAKEDKVIKVERDFKVRFSASSICVQSTEWTVAADSINGRRLIITGTDRYNYFRIAKTQFGGIYNIEFCPSVCSTCRFACGTLGGLRDNGKILSALDGNKLPVEFIKA